ncbi:MAG: NIPSNAP family protein [Terriglobales bacterium]
MSWRVQIEYCGGNENERETSMTLNCWKIKSRKSERWRVCAMALLSFAAGSLITARLAHIDQVRADSNRIFELRIYHTVPGKVPELESRFRNTTSKILAKHDLKVVGYWVPEGASDWDNTFIFMLAHSSREEAKKNWDSFRADPEFQEVLKTEQANKTVEKIDVTYMRPTDFSPMK